MICTSIITCLSSGLAKNNKIMSMFVLFSLLFGHFESLAFFSKMGGRTLQQSSRIGRFSQYFKDTACKVTIFQKSAATFTKK